MQRNKMKYSAAPKGNMENTVYIYISIFDLNRQWSSHKTRLSHSLPRDI